MLVALDCANAQRMGQAATLLDKVPLSLDIDHHHDNTRFGKINLVVADASSTGEIVRDILRELEVELTPEIAEALYVALVTDTGRFQYTNTTPKALRLAAELVEAGVDVHRVFQGIYESVEFAKLKLLARALERAEIYEGGRLVISHSCGRTSPSSAWGRSTPRGSSTTSARSTARTWRRSSASRPSRRTRSGA